MPALIKRQWFPSPGGPGFCSLRFQVPLNPLSPILFRLSYVDDLHLYPSFHGIGYCVKGSPLTPIKSRNEQ